MALALGQNGALRHYLMIEHHGVVDAVGRALAAKHGLRPELAQLLVDLYRAARRRQVTEVLRRKPRTGHAVKPRRVNGCRCVSVLLAAEVQSAGAAINFPTVGAA